MAGLTSQSMQQTSGDPRDVLDVAERRMLLSDSNLVIQLVRDVTEANASAKAAHRRQDQFMERLAAMEEARKEEIGQLRIEFKTSISELNTKIDPVLDYVNKNRSTQEATQRIRKGLLGAAGLITALAAAGMILWGVFRFVVKAAVSG